MSEPTESTELVITRLFNAPRERVYQAFTDPDQLVQWFGPVGFSVPRESVVVDARVGGHGRLIMVNDIDPTWRASFEVHFTEVVEHEVLAGTQEFVGAPGLQGRPGRKHLRIEFHDQEGTTRLTLYQGPYSEPMASMARAGWESSFTTLAAMLGGQTPTPPRAEGPGAAP